ncbi:Iq-domain [Thalictrum thalictroides]|uniref:Iq-domain n=1 Tax=Thalictrum thalictroides TaxID=46969 RepID=A0A7J6UX83_THATH|nr:Iq-domain [Thalictrum thalictroides]
MGSGDWFKTIISLKKSKKERSKQGKGSSETEKSNGFNELSHEKSSNGAANTGVYGRPVEDIAAIRIQTAFRRYKARKHLRRLKGVVRFKVLAERQSVTKQASTALAYINSWSRIQSQIRARRQCMVTEGRIRQKKLENQMKLEAKLQELEVEWCGGSDTMEEILGRIQQREEAAVKRERAMAYAFSHQWRANSSPYQGKTAYELGANMGWSWMERWIAARPWESRLLDQSISPKKVQSKQVGKHKSPTGIKVPVSVKPALSNGKAAVKVKGASYIIAEKPAGQEANSKAVSLSPYKAENTIANQETLVS